MKTLIHILFICSIFSATALTAGEYLNLSQELVATAMEDDPYQSIADKLANADIKVLNAELDSDDKKKTFWLNVYNGFVQHLLMDNPELFEDRNAFFTNDRITIAGQELSLDDIEHGMIRGSKIKLSMGFLGDPFAGSFEKKFRVEELDPRIHFALNCGAASCPAVAIYSASNIDYELDQTSREFLNKTTDYEPENNVVLVTTLFSWFRGDFGGKDGAKEYLKRYDIIPATADPDVEFKEYDWTLMLRNFKEL